MRIAIIGAGAMGSLFGAFLLPVAEVCLIDPYADHVRAITENGLKIEGVDGRVRTCRLSAVTDPSAVKPGIDFAIVFTKSRMTESAARIAAPLLAEKGLALTLQNGVGNREVIAGVLGEGRTVAGVTSHGGTLLGPGRVRHGGEGPTLIGEAGWDVDIAPILELFRAAGLDVEMSKDVDSLIWGKLVINAGINALAAILRVPNGVLGLTPECEGIMAGAVEEAVAVAGALGIRLPYENPLAHVRSVCEKTAANRASMLQDILRGADTEVDVINGAVVRYGAGAGIGTPCNRFLREIIKALEATSPHRCG
jgi:2-dehydropantoate 2-reductase